MKEYKFLPQKDMTTDEIAAIFQIIFEYSTFMFIPKGAERHFIEIDIPDIENKDILGKVKELFRL